MSQTNIWKEKLYATLIRCEGKMKKQEFALFTFHTFYINITILNNSDIKLIPVELHVLYSYLSSN